jgi:hypothetical protein
MNQSVKEWFHYQACGSRECSAEQSAQKDTEENKDKCKHWESTELEG